MTANKTLMLQAEQDTLKQINRTLEKKYKKHGFSKADLHGALLVIASSALDLKDDSIDPGWLQLMNEARQMYRLSLKLVVEERLKKEPK